MKYLVVLIGIIGLVSLVSFRQNNEKHSSLITEKRVLAEIEDTSTQVDRLINDLKKEKQELD